ncbi:hypothetical protein BE21_10890 [Sorangium cellulosum]|uniref:Uncharacterized protein n=1 Tax=Sorangium cellulosum TaxID=56 RepID=A0A150U103_SORCE|nr:hypothetical protein BE21_10890 [Sorangium cellulosum]
MPEQQICECSCGLSRRPSGFIIHRARGEPRAGRSEQTSAQRSNKLLTSVMNALGYAATGIEPSCGPLPGFLA